MVYVYIYIENDIVLPVNEGGGHFSHSGARFNLHEHRKIFKRGILKIKVEKAE